MLYRFEKYSIIGKEGRDGGKEGEKGGRERKKGEKEGGREVGRKTDQDDCFIPN